MELIAVLGRTYGVIRHLLSLERYDIIAEGAVFVNRKIRGFSRKTTILYRCKCGKNGV